MKSFFFNTLFTDVLETEEIGTISLTDFCLFEAGRLPRFELKESFIALATTILLLNPQDRVLVVKIAHLSFEYGNSENDIDFFSYAISVLNQSLSLTEESFEVEYLKYKCRYGIYLFSQDRSSLVWAVEHILKADRLLDKLNIQSHSFLICFYLDKGKIHLSLYLESLELIDLSVAETSFNRALELCDGNVSEIHFYIGEMLACKSMHLGRKSMMKEALKHFSKAIFLSFRSKGDCEAGYKEYWLKYALNAKRLFEITCSEEDFILADEILKNSLQIFSTSSLLQLSWGELYLYSGWLKGDLNRIETGLEKLTSFRGEIDDFLKLKLSGLLATGIGMLGHFLEDPDLLREGRVRILSLLSSFPINTDLLFAAGMTYLCSGLYFDDERFFSSAVAYFSACVDLEPHFLKARYGLYKAYFSWGSFKRDLRLLGKSSEIINFIISLRPDCALYRMFKGCSLLAIGKYDFESAYAEFYFKDAENCFLQAWRIENRFEILSYWGQSCLLIGKLLNEEEFYKKAIKILNYAESLFPNKNMIMPFYLEALFEYGYYFFNKESLFQVVDLTAGLLKNDGFNELLWMFLGGALVALSFCCSEMGYLKEDVDSLRRSAEKFLIKALNLGSLEADYWLACLYSIENLLDKSLYYLRRALMSEVTPPMFFSDRNLYLKNLKDSELFRKFLSEYEALSYHADEKFRSDY
ncbi:MAG: hypothetical protein RSB82_03120 [Victivallaceae bacterium]